MRKIFVYWVLVTTIFNEYFFYIFCFKILQFHYVPKVAAPIHSKKF